MSTFAKCNGAEFNFLLNDLVSVQTHLKEAYSRAEKLQTQINEGKWTGKSKDTMQAYLNLLLQYHGAFIGKPSNPLQEAVDTLNQLMKSLEGFYSECAAFQELEKLS